MHLLAPLTLSVSAEQVLTTALACVLLIVVPGPSVLFVVGRALTHGRRVALASVLGNSLGCYAAAICVAVGLGPLLQRSEMLFITLKVAGATYLLWLGIQAIRRSSATTLPSDDHCATESTWRAVRTGALVGISNPKAFIIFAAVLPPFLDPTAGHLTSQMLQLALVPLLLSLVTDSAWGLAAGRARTWLSSSPGRARTVGQVGGTSMVGLGISVALTGRPQAG